MTLRVVSGGGGAGGEGAGFCVSRSRAALDVPFVLVRDRILGRFEGDIGGGLSSAEGSVGEGLFSDDGDSLICACSSMTMDATCMSAFGLARACLIEIYFWIRLSIFLFPAVDKIY